MKIKRVPLQLDAAIYSAEWDVDRSAGVHLMQIVEKLEEDRMAVLGERQKKGGWGPESLEAAKFAGFMHEHFMAWHIIEVECQRYPYLVRPGEYFWCHVCNESLAIGEPKRADCLRKGHKGIFATPDALRVDTMRLKEWKFTWKSMRRAGGDEDTEYEHLSVGIWRWPVQTMAYCKLLDVAAADQEVMFVCGDYTDKQPSLQRYEMEFTPRDLRENWDSIVNKAEELEWL